jgi:hypothetical protein
MENPEYIPNKIGVANTYALINKNVEDLLNGKMSITGAAVLSKAIDNYIKLAVTEIIYAKVRGEKPEIPFLNRK